MTIAKEGLNLIFAFLAFTIGFGLLRLWPLTALVGVVTLFLFFFFRDPSRKPPDNPAAIVAPADGKVIEVVDEGDNTVRITIFMSLWDVHVNRVPFGGRVVSVDYRPGKFMPAYRPETHKKNEQNIIKIESGIGEYRFRQIAGILARRVVCHLKPGESVTTGQRCGVVKFGSRAEVELPSDKVEVIVTPGDIVRAGETTIAIVKEKAD